MKPRILSSKNVVAKNGRDYQVQFFEGGEASIASHAEGMMVKFDSNLEVSSVTGPGERHFKNEAAMYDVLKKAAALTMTIPSLRARVDTASQQFAGGMTV